MCLKDLLLLIFATDLSVWSFAASPVSFETVRDTTFAENLFRKAQKLENAAIYDSAVYYYEAASREFGKNKYPEEYLKCKNNIITVKRNSAQDSALLNEAQCNLQFSLKKFGSYSAISGDCYYILGNVYSDDIDLDSALYYFRKSLTIWMGTIRNNDVRIANAYRSIGIVFNNKGLLDSARSNINKSVVVLRLNFGEDAPELAPNYNALGTIAYHLGKFDECEYYFGKVVRIREKSSGYSHPLTAEAYNNLAVLFMEKTMYDTALVLHRKAYEIRVSKLPENHPNIALSLNNIGNIYIAMGNYEPALEYHKKALAIRKIIYGEHDHSNMAMSYSNIGVVYLKLGKYEEALMNFVMALEILIKLYGEESPYTQAAYDRVGAVYADLGLYDKSLEYFKTALILQKRRGENAPGISMSYNNIGAIYKYKGDYDLALSFYRKSVEVIKTLFTGNHADLAEIYRNIGEIYLKKAQNDTALYYFNQALEIDIKYFGSDNAAVIDDYLKRGAAYGELNEIEKEIRDYFKGLDISLKTFGLLHPLTAVFYSDIAKNYLVRQQKDSALYYMKESLTITRSVYPANHPRIASAYRVIGELYERLGSIDSAKVAYQKALEANYPQHFNIDSVETSLILHEPEFASTLLDLCKLVYHQYEINRNYSVLPEILKYFDLVKSITYTVISDYVLEDTKIKLLNQVSRQTCYPVDAANILFQETGNTDYFIKAFEFSEFNKASVLYDLVNRYNGNRGEAIPDTILMRKKDLLGYVDFLQMKLHRIKDNSEYSVREKTQRMIDSLMICLRGINDTVYKYLIRSNTPYSLSGRQLYLSILSKLKNNEALISYYIADSALFTFIMEKDSLVLHKKIVPIPNSLKSLAEEYLTSLKKYEREKIPLLSGQLYNIVFSDIEKAVKDKNKLIIIPDKHLLLVPFETLCRDMSSVKSYNDFKDPEYLLKKFEISYNYSGGLWCLNNSRTVNPADGLLAFAPVFPGEIKNIPGNLTDEGMEKRNPLSGISSYKTVLSEDLVELPYSLAETDSLKTLCNRYGLDADIYTFVNATEKNLRQNIGNYRYIHIATHEIMDDSYPEYSGLVFSDIPVTSGDGNILPATESDGILYAKELYPLKLNADLVTMSACETGLGKYEEGEGIIGLVRGFISAGARNVLYTYWKVGDKNTMMFMNNFYNFVLSGDPYSTAMRKAKLNLIKTPETSFPFLWGGFAIIGE
jgi:CHAT domain-containing protein/Tfp pilus assembly protein PilF